jgi:hypothetical protein
MAFDGKLLSGVTVLIAMVEAGTIARVAKALGLSPSGVSRALLLGLVHDGNRVSVANVTQTAPGDTIAESSNWNIELKHCL